VNGMSDNLLTSVIRAWDTDASVDGKKKLILVAPAMNTVRTQTGFHGHIGND
jgi:phosphopantothenoylcysteine decarboxylase